jgi:hypothetical protein
MRSSLFRLSALLTLICGFYLFPAGQPALQALNEACDIEAGEEEWMEDCNEVAGCELCSADCIDCHDVDCLICTYACDGASCPAN